MNTIVSSLIIFAIALMIIKLVKAANKYEKILSFYLAMCSGLILIIINSAVGYENILDIAIILLLLQIPAILFLLHNKKS
ncbi:MAG: hypothetical protein KGQ36_04640 [Rickettsiales bacterium]|nr:hypothetical protein [Rickettsiales bacterium]